MPKLVWRVKLVAELEPGVTTETEVACLQRNEEAGLADLGLRLDEAKQLTAALQAEMVSAQVAVVGERRRWCAACERPLASKGHYRATFRSLFGDVPVRVRRLLVCPCQGPGEPKSFAALDLGAGPAPELAYVTAKFAALAPFGKVAALLSELLPISGAQNAGTVRNRTLRVGQDVVPQRPTKNAELPAAPAAGPVVVGLDGGYVRSRHRPERHFEVVAGKVIDARGAQHRFAFARNGPATASAAFRQALAAAGVGADTPATVLCDGDAGLWRLQREALPGATIVLDWWHAAVRFEHALQAARGLGAGTADASLAHSAVRTLDRAKWCLWHGRWTGCRRKLAALRRWTRRKPMRDGGRHRPPPATRQRPAGLPRAQSGCAGALRGPASARRADLDGVRGERGQRDRGQAHEQGTADALEQSDRAALPGRAHGRAERHTRGRLPATLSGLPARE